MIFFPVYIILSIDSAQVIDRLVADGCLPHKGKLLWNHRRNTARAWCRWTRGPTLPVMGYLMLL